MEIIQPSGEDLRKMRGWFDSHKYLRPAEETLPRLQPLAPNGIKYQCIVPDGEWRGNIENSLKRPLMDFRPALIVNCGAIAIVGSGFSAADHVEDIRAHCGKIPVLAVKGAHDWLIERGIVPDAMVAIDPQEKIRECVKHKSQSVCYLLASQVHPTVYDWLSDCQVVRWNAWAGEEAKGLAPDQMWVGGGSTSGMKALSLAWLLGFRKFILYGFDSCIREDGVKRLDGAVAGTKPFPVRVGINGKDRWCNGAMAAQAKEFQDIFVMMPGVQVKVVGDGLIADIMAERVRLGFNDWEE